MKCGVELVEILLKGVFRLSLGVCLFKLICYFFYVEKFWGDGIICLVGLVMR